MTDLYRHFASTDDLYNWAAPHTDLLSTTYASGWSHGTQAFHAGLKTLRDGNEANVPAATKRLTQFENEHIVIPTRTWGHGLVGAFPDTPRYITGLPDSMWTQQPDLSDRTPLRVFVGLTSSAGIDEADLMKRGVTLAAFALAMVNVRPVLITPYVNLGSWERNHNSLISWDIRTSPLVLSQLIGNLSDPNVTRHVGIPISRLLNPRVNGSWHRDYDNEAAMRCHLGAQPADLYLPSIHLYDELLTNPLAWIKDKLAQYTPEDDN